MLTSYASRFNRQSDQSYDDAVRIRKSRVTPPQLDFIIRPYTPAVDIESNR